MDPDSGAMTSLVSETSNPIHSQHKSENIDVFLASEGLERDEEWKNFYGAFCHTENTIEGHELQMLYWTPVAYLILFIVLLIVDGLIPRLCSCWCSRTPPTAPLEAQPFDVPITEDLHLDPDYEAKMVHNPEMLMNNGPSARATNNLTTERPAPSSSVAPSAPSTESVSRVASSQVPDLIAVTQQMPNKDNAGRSVKQAATGKQ